MDVHEYCAPPSFWVSSFPPYLHRYPYFLRTIPSDTAAAGAAAQYFQYLQHTAVATIHLNDEYGSGLADAFESAAAEMDIFVSKASFAMRDDGSIKAALEALAASGLRVFFCISFEDDLMSILNKAVELGVICPGYLWIFSDAISNSFFSRLTEPSLIEAVNGNGRLGSSGANYGSVGYNKMVNLVWPDEDNNLDFYSKYLNLTASFFSQNPPADLEFYAFDATIAFGLAACAAATVAKTRLTGAEILAQVKNNSFSGVSGLVEFERSTGSRKVRTGNFYLSNLIGNGSKVNVEAVSGKWDSVDGWRWPVEFVQSEGFGAVPTCDAGSYYDANHEACVHCHAGTSEAAPGVRLSCTACERGSFAPAEGSLSCGSCANGQVALIRGSTACIVCPTGATCDDTSSLIVNPGMWRTSADSLGIYECPFGPHACLGGNATNENCADGYGGVLCAVCSNGEWFVRNSSSTFEPFGCRVQVLSKRSIAATTASHSPLRSRQSSQPPLLA